MAEVLTYGEWDQPVVGPARVDKQNVVSIEIHIPRKNPVDYSYLNLRKAPKDLVPLPCMGAEKVDKQGFHVIVYAYQGNVDPSSFDSSPEEIVYELEGSDEESNIETHPQFLALVKKYGGTYNADGSFAGFPRIRLGGKAGEKNPLFGIDTFLDVGWIFTKSFTSGAYPANALQNVGCIDTPDFGDTGLRATRDYIKLAPRISKRGNVWSATERWRAGGRNGINRDVYRTSDS